jgi:putative ABC transport system ATP-binding protein
VTEGRTRVQMTSVVVAYDGVPRLHDISFQLDGGQLLAVTGSAGAGKTTLLWALAGHLPVEQGEVTLHSPVRRRGQLSRVVLMPQGNALAGTLSAYENVLVPLLSTGISPADAEARAQAALAGLGLSDARGQLTEELSGGQQQRVCVARGLALSGDVVLADEPTSAVDAANRAVVMRLLRGEADRGAVVVMATHDDEAAAACDGELHLADGRMTWARPLSRSSAAGG